MRTLLALSFVVVGATDASAFKRDVKGVETGMQLQQVREAVKSHNGQCKDKTETNPSFLGENLFCWFGGALNNHSEIMNIALTLNDKPERVYKIQFGYRISDGSSQSQKNFNQHLMQLYQLQSNGYGGVALPSGEVFENKWNQYDPPNGGITIVDFKLQHAEEAAKAGATTFGGPKL